MKKKYSYNLEEGVMTKFAVWCAGQKRRQSHVIEELVRKHLERKGGGL